MLLADMLRCDCACTDRLCDDRPVCCTKIQHSFISIREHLITATVHAKKCAKTPARLPKGEGGGASGLCISWVNSHVIMGGGGGGKR